MTQEIYDILSIQILGVSLPEFFVLLITMIIGAVQAMNEGVIIKRTSWRNIRTNTSWITIGFIVMQFSISSILLSGQFYPNLLYMICDFLYFYMTLIGLGIITHNVILYNLILKLPFRHVGNHDIASRTYRNLTKKLDIEFSNITFNWCVLRISYLIFVLTYFIF